MTDVLKVLIIFFVIVFLIVGGGALSNTDEQDWQTAKSTTSSAMSWFPVIGCGGLILFIMMMALSQFSSSSSSSSSSASDQENILNEFPDAAEIDMGSGRSAVRVKGRFFIFQQYRGGEASVQEVDRKGRPISGVVYQNKDSYRFGKSPGESLGEYVKSKVKEGRSIPK